MELFNVIYESLLEASKIEALKKERIKLSLNNKDLRVDIFSNGTHLGDCYIRITHMPTGTVSSCDNECFFHAGLKNIPISERRKCAMGRLNFMMEDPYEPIGVYDGVNET